jgi:hypothetical protein
MNAPQTPIFASPENLRVFGTMIGTSFRAPLQPEHALDWSKGLDRTRPPKLPETSWIYGTPYWDRLTEAQRLEVLWLENARDVSNFITLEQYLPPLYMGYLIAFGPALAPEIEEYMMIFAKEELVHTLMFRRYMELGGLPAFELPRREGYNPVLDLLEHSPRTTPPILAVLWTLFLEWTAELNAMHGTQSDSIDSLTRQMYRVHHIDEVRHLAFGKRVVEDFYAACPRQQWDYIVNLMKPAIRDVYAEFRFTEQICDLTSFEFPVAKDDAEAINVIRNSENNKRLHHERFHEIDEWLAKLELL